MAIIAPVTFYPGIPIATVLGPYASLDQARQPIVTAKTQLHANVAFIQPILFNQRPLSRRTNNQQIVQAKTSLLSPVKGTGIRARTISAVVSQNTGAPAR